MTPAAHPGRLLKRELNTRSLSANRLALDLGPERCNRRRLDRGHGDDGVRIAHRNRSDVERAAGRCGVIVGLLDPHARFVAVDELDAGFLESVLNRFDGARLQTLAGLQPRDGIRGDLRHGREFTHADLERRPRHPALLGVYQHDILFSG